MAGDALLSDLCSICNSNKSKYRCPGCAARTCSLPCYKRHQQWAQCTGKRDPTKYVKKSQLATPAGIDHDFNYLTSVERELERAERHIDSTVLGNASALQKDAPVRKITDQHLATAGVTVIRAPKGLSRQKVNKTRPGKTGNIVWTVEWIREDKTRILTESSSALPLLQIQPFRASEKGKISRRLKRVARKRALPKSSADQDASIPPMADNEESRVEAENENQKPATPRRPDPGQDDATTNATHYNDNVKVDTSDYTSSHVNVAEPEPLPQLYSFFLLRPRTSSSRQVLIPLAANDTLADCLRGHTVLEFPTIYAFPVPNQPPSEDFVLEKEYLVAEGEQQREFEDLMKDISPETLHALKASDDDNNAATEIDSKAILDVLKQDLGAGV